MERTWRNGLHQAVEAKEAAPITEETRGLARVARQRFFGRYATVCGMTGTAAEAAREFRAAYGLPVVTVPPHRPSRRVDLPARYFPTREDRTAGVVAEAVAAHHAGRPALIGTTTVAGGRAVSAALAGAGLKHAVLDGLQDAAEADLVAAAGRSAAVTVATDMAGRGTDVKPDPAALAAGGLCVLACERHASARVDRQLAGPRRPAGRPRFRPVLPLRRRRPARPPRPPPRRPHEPVPAVRARIPRPRPGRAAAAGDAGATQRRSPTPTDRGGRPAGRCFGRARRLIGPRPPLAVSRVPNISSHAKPQAVART